MARLEYMRGDLERARHFLNKASDLHRVVPRERAQQALLSIEVLLRARTGHRRIPKTLLDRLQRIHTRTSAAGYKDFEVGALLVGLLVSGEADRARVILADYGRVRRSSLREQSVLREVRREL
jgi:hypothetical protein